MKVEGKQKEVMQYFNAHAERYGYRTEQRFRDIPTFLAENVKDGSLILDVGCGKGEFLQYIKANFNYEVVGIDISRRMLSFHTSSSNVVQGDAIRLPFKSNIFDVIYMDTLIHHIVASSYYNTLQLQKEAIREALRVLKPRGYLIIQELYYDFVYSFGCRFLFYWLLTANKIGIPPAPGQPPVIISPKTKKQWDEFINGFSNATLLKKSVYPHQTDLKFRLLGIREVGNILYYLQKKSPKDF